MNELKSSKVQKAIKDARRESGADVGMIMENVVPIIYEVQGHIMEPLGFVPDDDGFASFAEQLTKHESNDEFLQLSKQLKSIMKESVTPLVGEESEEEEDDEENEDDNEDKE